MRFRKSVKIGNGLKVNLSKSGASLSLGGRGNTLNIGSNGVKHTIGIPGSGISHSTQIISGSSSNNSLSSNASYSSTNSTKSTIGSSFNVPSEGQTITRSDAVENNGLKIVSMTCPSCGATLQIDAENRNVTCEYCGNSLFIDDGASHVTIDDPEQMGYQFEKGRQRAQAEQLYSQPNTYVQSNDYSPPKKRHTVLWILGWLLIFPLPLTILLVRKKNMKPVLKFVILVVAWTVYLVIGLSGNAGDNVTDMDVITREGHPTLYGSVQQSHEVWDDVSGYRVHFGDLSYGHSGQPVVSMSAYDSDVIKEVYINFSNFREPISVSLDEALKIAASYMPFEIINNYYELSCSSKYIPDETTGDDSEYYVVLYTLSDYGKTEVETKKHEYYDSIYVILNVSNNAVKYVTLTNRTPDCMSYYRSKYYQEVAWSCNLYDYAVEAGSQIGS